MRARVSEAIRCYHSQTWANKELIVVDDGPDLIADLIEGIPDARYIHHPAANLSAKRNAGIQAARGDLICHFDADDWSSPHRIADQVELMQTEKLNLAGYGTCYFWNEDAKEASFYCGSIWGATLIYRRTWALDHLFDESISYGEDLSFISQAFPWVASKDARENMVCVLHSTNQKPTRWPLVDQTRLPKAFQRAVGVTNNTEIS